MLLSVCGSCYKGLAVFKRCFLGISNAGIAGYLAKRAAFASMARTGFFLNHFAKENFISPSQCGVTLMAQPYKVGPKLAIVLTELHDIK